MEAKTITDIEEGSQNKDSPSSEHSSDEDKIKSVEHNITTNQTQVKPFKCEICKMTFSHIDSYTSHVDIHSLSVTYSCDLCYKTFSRSFDLMKHKRIHTGEKPYSCDTCEKSFTLKWNLNQHKRTHTGEKQFFCEICQKSYSFSSGLSSHKKTTRHLKMSESIKNIVKPPPFTHFVDCGEADIKIEIKEEETFNEDPLSVSRMDADNDEESMKQENRKRNS